MVSYLTNCIPIIQLLLVAMMAYFENSFFGKVYEYNGFILVAFMSYCFFYNMRNTGLQEELMFCLSCFFNLLIIVELLYLDFSLNWRTHE